MAILAEFFCTRDEGYLFLAGDDGGEPDLVRFPVSAVVEETVAFIEALGDESDDMAGPALRSIVQSIVERSAEHELVWIVPHDVLHYLPFHALPTDEGLLGFRNPLCYTPSASVLSVCRAAPRLDGKPVVALGDPTGDLRYARREAENVATTFHGECHIGSAATRQTLLDALGRHDALDILHLACHGQAGASDPLESGVFLAPSSLQRGRGPDLMTAREILHRSLHAGLVTVSACDAGLGTVESADEVLGLTRALLYAGAASVLLSYWPVDDFSTSITIERFYAELQRMTADGAGDKARALRTAQQYVHDLTLRDVITLCDNAAEQSAQRSDPRAHLDLRIEAAELVVASHDYDEALQRYQRIRQLTAPRTGTTSERYEWTLDRIEEIEFRQMFRRQPIDYTSQPFRSPTHWASFFLHGDWKL